MEEEKVPSKPADARIVRAVRKLKSNISFKSNKLEDNKDKEGNNPSKKNKMDLVDIDKNKENKLGERQKEKENNTEDKGQQRYVSPRNMWKKRFFRFNNSNNKEFNLSDKENKEEKEDKEEKEEKINTKEKKVKINPNLKVISNYKNSEQENEP